MQKTHCRDCQGTELYDTVLSARNGVIIGRRMPGGDQWILVHCLICLACGYVMPYLNDEGLDRLRHWAYEGAPPPDEHPGIAAAQAAAAMGREAPSVSPVVSDSTPDAPPDANPAPKTDGEVGFGTIVIFCLIVGTILGLVVVFYGLTHE